MTYSELKAAIAEVIKTNYNQEITAVVLQDLLDSMVGMTQAQDERVLGEAKDYTDEREVVIREDFAAADAVTLASAKAYTDDREKVIRTDFAASDAETLQSAKDYADTHKVDKTEIGVAGGVASLDAGGLVPSSQLPSYVDDVLEYPSPGDFPSAGEAGKIYVTKDTNLTYRWSGTGYVEISKSLALGETSSTAYRGDRGKVAYDHSQIKDGSNPHGTTFGSLPDKPSALPADGGNADTITDQSGSGNKKIWTGTEDELVLINPRDSNTVYLVFKTESGYLSAAPASLSFSGKAEAKSLQIRCNASLAWTLSGLPVGWSASSTSGIGPATVTINATQGTQASSGAILVSGGGMSASVPYTQAVYVKATIYLVLVKTQNGCAVVASGSRNNVSSPVAVTSNVEFTYDSATHTSAVQYMIQKGNSRYIGNDTDYIEQGTPYPEGASIWFEFGEPSDDTYVYAIGDTIEE